MAEDKTFDEIMESITSGITGEWEHDRGYLKEQMEAKKDHPLSKEILRACGRLMYELIPEEKRSELERVMGNHRSATDTTLEEAAFNMGKGNWAKALELIEPLAAKMDSLVESDWNADDSESRYFNLRSVTDEVVWRTHNEEPRTIRGATEPFARIYFTYGSCLFEAQRYDEAIEACSKAIRWNPADVGLRFELGENYKRLGDMKSYERILNELYPYVATAAELAHYHRAMGYLHIELGNFKLAAAHLMVSLFFENSSLPLSEVMYIKMQYGQDYTDMTPQDALDVLRKAGEKVFPDEDTFDALNQLLRVSFRHGDYQTTLTTAIELYNFTHSEEYEKIARQLTEALDGGSGEDEG